MIRKFRSIIPSVLVLLISAAVIWLSQSDFVGQSDSAARLLVPPPKETKYFAFGYQESIADSLWLRYIQDFDYCSRNDPKFDSSKCTSSWAFQMLDVITDLTPKFRMAYALGGLSLSVLISDPQGSTIIFDKAVSAFPEDNAILYRAAYHFMEVGQFEKSSALLVRAAKTGGPPWLYSLAARVKAKGKAPEFSLTILKNMRANSPEGPARDRIDVQIKELEKEIASQE